MSGSAPLTALRETITARPCRPPASMRACVGGLLGRIRLGDPEHQDAPLASSRASHEPVGAVDDRSRPDLLDPDAVLDLVAVQS